MDFFRAISAKDGWVQTGYNKHVEVSKTESFFGGQDSYKVIERDKLTRFNPLRLYLSPISTSKKLTNVEALAGMTEAFAKEIVNDPGCHLGRISKVYQRMAGNLSRNTTPEEAEKIYRTLEKAVITLQNTAIKEGMDYFVKGQPGRFRPTQAIARHLFYNKLAKTIWPLRFNERFHIGQTKSGDFEVHLTKNRWFFQKWFAIPEKAESWRDYFARPESPAAAKIANAENLAKMVVRDKELIRSQGVDVDGVITNLERIKGKMTSHTNSLEKARIEQAVDGAIGDLQKIGKLIAKDKTRSVGNFIWRWTVAPVATAITSAVGTTASFVWEAVKLPFHYIGGTTSQA